ARASRPRCTRRADNERSHAQIDLAHRTHPAILAQVDAARAHQALGVVGSVLEAERGVDPAEVERADTGLVQALQSALALDIGRPQPQLRPGRVGLVDPAVAVVIERGELGEAVAAGRAEELATVVDTTVGVAVEREEAAAAQQWELLLAAVAV